MFYKINYTVQGKDPLQQTLNAMYQYENDLNLQVMHRKRLNLFCEILQELIRKKRVNRSGTALDIGCNSGLYTKILKDHGFRKVTGIDIGERAIRIAKETFKDEVNEGSLVFENRGIETVSENEGFDLILCTEVIEHTDDPMGAIQSIRKAMAPGSLAIISLPNCISIGYGLEYLKHLLLRKPVSKDLHEHLQYPFWRTLSLFRSDKELRRLKSTGTNLFLFKIILVLLRKTGRLATFVNRADSYLSTLFPFKYFTQFFFVVIEKRKI